MNRVESWKVAIEKLSKKISNWRAKAISFGGRLTLVKSILGSLTLYFLLLFHAPKGVIKELERVTEKKNGGGLKGVNLGNEWHGQSGRGL